MLYIIEHEDGKAEFLPVMSSLGIDSSEANSIFLQHDERRRRPKQQAQERRKTSFLSLRNNVLKN